MKSIKELFNKELELKINNIKGWNYILSLINSYKRRRVRHRYLFSNLSDRQQKQVLDLLPEHLDSEKLIESNYIISTNYTNSYIVVKRYNDPLYKIMLIIGCNKDIQTNMELLSMVLKGDPVYTNIDVQSNKNTEKVILNNGFYKLSKLIDGIIKRIYVFSTNQVSSPDNRIYCNKEYLQTIIDTKEISRHTRNTLKEYLELLK
jgi:hypothetical protein